MEKMNSINSDFRAVLRNDINNLWICCRFCSGVKARSLGKFVLPKCLGFDSHAERRRHSRREIAPLIYHHAHRVIPPMRSLSSERPAGASADALHAPAATIRRASLIKINYICRVIVRLIESRDSAAVAAESFRPETKVENRTAESTFCTDTLLSVSLISHSGAPRV